MPELARHCRNLRAVEHHGKRLQEVAGLDDDASERAQHLTEATEYYRKSVNKQVQEPLADPYPIVNWLMIEVLHGNTKLSYESWLSKTEILGRQRFQTMRKALDLFAVADITLIRACLNRKMQDECSKLVENYRRVFAESGATPREQDSALTQMEFVRTILNKLPAQNPKIVTSTIELLDYIEKQLQQREQSVVPPPGEAKQGDQGSLSPEASSKQPARTDPTQKKKARRHIAGRNKRETHH